MNQAQLISLARTLVQIGGSLAIGAGYMKAEDLQSILHNGEMLITAAALIGTTLWGLYERRTKLPLPAS